MPALARIALILLLGAVSAMGWATGTGALLATRDYPRVFQRAAGPELESGYALAQDRDGFIWVGTQSGVVRWDGHRARTYAADPAAAGGLPDSYVRAMLVDRTGTLWVGTKSGGLARHDQASDSFSPLHDSRGLVGKDIVALAERQPSGIWIGSNSGLAWLEPTDGRITREHLPLAMGAIQCMVVAGDGTLWIGSDRGLWSRPAGRAQFAAVPIALPAGSAPVSVLRLLEDRTGRVWVGTRLQGTFVVAPGAGAAGRLPGGDAGLAGDTVYALADAGNGEVWIGTYGDGVVRVDLASGALHRERHDALRSTSLLDDDVGALMRGRDGILWVASAYGLSTYDTRFDGIATLEGGSGRAIRDANVPAVMAGAGGAVFLANGSYGLEILLPAGKAPAVLRPDPARSGTSLPRARVISLAPAADGSAWVGTQGGLYLVSADGAHVRRIEVAGRGVSADVWAIAADGPTLWVGGSDGLWALDVSDVGSVKALRHLDAELHGTQVRALAIGAHGELWIGTNGHVFRFESGLGRLHELVVDPADDRTLPGGLVSGLAVDRAGRLWVATLGHGVQVQVGLDAAGLPAFRRLTTSDGLPNNGVDALVVDSTGQVWASTDDGLARIDPATFSIQSLRAAQGAGISTFWTGAATATSDGRLLFGGEGGLLLVDPARLPGPAGRLAPPVVTEAGLGGRMVTAGQLSSSREASLPASAPRLQVEFASLAYGEQDVLRYAYRLEGFDTDWNEAASRNRTASYTKLPPGHYRLDLRVARPGGEWSDATAIALRVEPRWFERRDVRVAGMLACMVLAWRLHLWRVRLAARRQASLEHEVRLRTSELEQSRSQIRLLSMHNARALELERTRVSRELHDEMAQQLAALRMEVAMMHRFSNQTVRGEDLPVQGLMSRVDAIIRSIRELVTQLRPPALDGGLIAAIRWMAARFEQQTEIACALELADCPGFTHPDAATMAFRVVQESLTNIRRHANAKTVRIRLVAEDGACRLEIIDDGVGFDPKATHAGYGLLGMEERAAALGASFEIISSSMQGTTVRVGMR
jgi:signal transduction histidine kinase/ligand-binding sensor domain-containing protein